MNKTTQWLKSLSLAALLAALTACGGDSSKVIDPIDVGTNKTTCETSDDENTDPNCGKLLLGITDADGDFLNYSVQVTGLELTRADGTNVSVLTTNQTVNFVDYVEISELAAAATIPTGVYTAGRIEIDYSEADIQVEKDGTAVAASMVDETGSPLTITSLELQFDETNRLVIARNRPAMLELDFNLGASHQVDLTMDPVTITTEPYIMAEIDPVISKEFRVRGPLIRVNQDESLFRIAVRPFHRRIDRFGGVNINTNDQTNFEINGETFIGAEGLAAMATLEAETPTVTLGNFERNQDRFTAITVLAGSSVPGAESDAVRGVVIARTENQLTVSGASLIRTDGSLSFDDQITVLLSEQTKVTKKRRHQDSVTISDISIGQAVTVLGAITEDSDNQVLDATDGHVRMRLTALSGHSLSSDELTLNVALQAIQARQTANYDFSGTGMDPSFDADPNHYEINIGDLLVTNVADNSPLRVTGFVSAFGSAPADFDAISVIDYSESRSQLLVNWPEGDEVITFSEITDTSLTINSSAEGGTYKLIQGGIRTDLNDLSSAVVISSSFERGLFTIKSDSGVSAFSNFAEFITTLQQRLAEGDSIDLIHGTGGFNHSDSSFNVIKLAVRLN